MESEFIPGVLNVSADGLSRGQSIQQVRMNDPRMTSEASLLIPVEGIFDLCYSDEPVLSDSQFMDFWRALKPTIMHTVAHSVLSP